MSKKKNTILVVDDEPQFLKMIEMALDATDFKLEGCLTGKEALRLSVMLKPDLILLDINLPDMNGYEIITAIRTWSQTPIIVISARAEEEATVMALGLGADDYVTKPFNMRVLEARISANLRQSAVRETGEPELSNGPLRIDLVRHEVYIGDQLASFTPKEYDMLRYFIVNCGKMLTHKALLLEVWGPAHGNDARYLRVFISKIRDKIDALTSLPSLITTAPGVGYRMEVLPPYISTLGTETKSVA